MDKSIYMTTTRGRRFTSEDDWRQWLREYVKRDLPTIDWTATELDLHERSRRLSDSPQQAGKDGRAHETEGEYVSRLRKWQEHSRNLLLYLYGRAELCQVN